MVLVGGGACPGPFGNSNPAVTLSVDRSIIAESEGVAIVTATLDQEIFAPVTVRLAYSGTAESGKDYTRSSMVITIPAMKTTGTVRISSIPDETLDGDRTVIVTIDSVTNGRAGSPDEVTITIIDESDGTAPTVSISLPDPNGAGAQVLDSGMTENDTSQVFARLSAPAYADVTVDLAISGTAVRDTNYTLSGTQIVIPAGKTEGSITVTGKVVEGFNNDLTVIFTIVSATGATSLEIDEENKEAVLHIVDTETPPTVTLTLDPTTNIAENGGVATITATLSRDVLVPVTIPFLFTGTPQRDTNYTISDDKIVIPAGETTGTLAVTGKDDGIYKGEQALTVKANNLLNANLAQGQGELTLTFEDSLPAPSITLSPATFVLNEDGGTATLTATLSAPVGLETTVSLKLTGTATENVDYTYPGGQIKIPSGQLSGSVTLTAKNDTTYEGSETIIVAIASVTNNVTIAGGIQESVGNINDSLQQPKVTLSLSGSPFAEAGGVAQVSATLTSRTYVDVTVNLGFTGTATKDTDYVASDTQIVIPKGSLSRAITLTGANNPNPVGDKTIIVDIASVTNATEDGTQQVTATVSDSLPMLTLSKSSSPMADQAGSTATVAATLSAAIATDLTIGFTFGGSTTKDTDYTASATQIVIPAGQTTGNTITLTRIGDNKYNPARAIALSGQQLTNAAYVGSSQVTIEVSGTTAAEYKAKGEAWLAQNATQPGVIVEPSGLQYKVIEPGAGDKPDANDRVFVAYTGTLIDGTVFDSNGGIAFGLNEVIAGWTEGLQLMPLNAKYMLYIPSNLAYGEGGSGSVPPNAALIFEVELKGIQQNP
jgi:FKBP-type peptidyl-prolyl cis-trans isomerase